MKTTTKEMKTASGADRKNETAPMDRRVHHRYPTNMTAEVYWTDTAGRLESANGVIRNISGGGFGVELEQSFERGQMLSVQTKAGALQCVVHHVRRDNAKYFVGMEVISASDGSNHERSLKDLAVLLDKSNKKC